MELLKAFFFLRGVGLEQLRNDGSYLYSRRNSGKERNQKRKKGERLGKRMGSRKRELKRERKQEGANVRE